MEFVTLILTPYNTYWYYNSFNEEISEEMLILSGFFMSDFACGFHSYQDWVTENSQKTSSNCTLLEKKNGFIFLSDLYAESKKPTYVKMTGQQFIQLCDEWEEKICKYRPKEVTIKHESDRFFIETNV